MDHTIDSAEVTNSTSVMMQTIAGDDDAIGYISLGSLNDTVKALKVDGVEATLDNVKSGDYKVSRPFNIVTKKDASEATKDFVNYIMSEEGQAIVEEEAIALDGIAVIVNLNNTLDEITSDSVLKIYTGEITKWSEVK